MQSTVILAHDTGCQVAQLAFGAALLSSPGLFRVFCAATAVSLPGDIPLCAALRCGAWLLCLLVCFDLTDGP